MEIENKIKELTEISKNRKITALQEAKTKKAIAWQSLKEKSPELALMLEIHFKAFGKPEDIKIYIENKLIYGG